MSRIRTGRLNETALMVQSQIEEKVNPAALWPGVSGEDLALWLFDAELTVERVATAGARAAIAGAEIPASTRADLAGALSQLSRAIRLPQPEGLERAARLAQEVIDHPSTPAANPAVRRLAVGRCRQKPKRRLRRRLPRHLGAHPRPPEHHARQPTRPGADIPGRRIGDVIRTSQPADAGTRTQ